MHPYLIVLLISGFLSALLAIFVWRRRSISGIRSFAAVEAAIAIWSFSYMFEFISRDLAYFVFWERFLYFGVLVIPISWLVFTIQFTGKGKWLTNRNFFLLGIEPVAMLVLVWSNEIHGWVWRDIHIKGLDPLFFGDFTYGWAFWVNIAFSYAYLFVGSLLLVQYLLNQKQLYKSQVTSLLLGVIAPWVGNAMSLLGLNPLGNFDLTLLGFIASGIVISWGLLRYHFLDIIPIAHTALIENMSDGLIVLDIQNRIVDVNPAVEKILNLPALQLIGKQVSELNPGLVQLNEAVQQNTDVRSEISLEISDSDLKRFFDVRISLITDLKGRYNGKLIVLRDITERIQTEETIRRGEAILMAVRFAATQFMKSTHWKDVLPDVLKQLGELAQVSRVYIFENHTGEDGVVRASQRYEWTAPGITAQIENPDLQDLSLRENGFGRWEDAFKQGLPIFGTMDELLESERKFLEFQQIQSIAVVPIFVGEKWWGRIGFDDCTQPRIWSHAEIDALEAAASTFGSVIQRMQIDGELRKRVSELDALYRTSLEITSPHELPVLLQTIVERAINLIGASSGGLYLCDHQRQVAVCMISYRTPRDFTGTVLKYGEGAAGIVAQTGQPLLIEDYREWSGRARVYEDDQPFRSVISAPMIWDNAVLGVIHVLHEKIPRRFSQGDLTLLTLFANQAAIALHNAQLIEQAQLRARRLAILNDITRVSLEIDSLQEMLNELVVWLSELLDADSSYVTLWDDAKKQITEVVAHGIYKEKLSQTGFLPGEITITGSALERSETIVEKDFRSSIYFSERIRNEFASIRSALAVPLIAGQEKFGAAIITFHDSHDFSKEEIELSEQAAAQISLAMAKTTSLDRERHRVNVLDALRSTFADISSEMELPDLLQTILERAVYLLKSASGGLYLYEPERQEVVFTTSFQISKDHIGTVLKYGEGAAGKVAQTGKPLLIDDYQHWEGRAEVYSDEDSFQSILSTPITWNNQVIGVLSINRDQNSNPFSQDDLGLMMLFSNQAAAALNNAQLIDSAQQRARRLGLLNDITRASLEIEDQGKLVQTLARQMAELLDAESCFISKWDSATEQVIPTAAYGPYAATYINNIFLPGDTTFTQTVITSGKTIIEEDYPNSPHNNTFIKQQFPDIRSMIAVPLSASGHQYGAVMIAFHKPHTFRQEEIELCEQAAAQISLAMDKTRALEAERRRANELDALRATVADFSGELELPVLLKAILERAVSLLDASGGDLGLYDPEKQEIDIVVSHNMGKDYSGTRQALGEGGMGLSVELDQIVVIPDYAKWEGRSAQFSDEDLHAAIAVPLRIGGRIVGSLGVVHKDPKRVFTSDDQRLLLLFAHQAAIAIDNARLFASQRIRAGELSILYESSVAITNSLDLATVCAKAAEQLSRAVQATSAYILACDLENDEATLIAEYFSPDAHPAERVSEIGKSYDLYKFPKSLEALHRGQTQMILVNDPEIDPMDREELEAHQVKSALEVPIIVSGKLFGFTEIWDSRIERIWGDEQIRVCQTLANQAAIAIENARLYKEMSYMAVTDTLTGIYNRRGFFEVGQRELNRSRRFERPLTAILLDIDHFKQVNDTFSHTIGDQVLIALTKTIKGNLRDSDILGRYGGEEFAILLPETDHHTAYKVAERLRQRIADTPTYTERGPVSITVSMGIACVENGLVELAVLLDRADTAMYSAKTKGRNQIDAVEPL